MTYFWIHFRAAIEEIGNDSALTAALRDALLMPRDMHGGNREDQRAIVLPHEFRPVQFGAVLNLAWEIVGRRSHFTAEKSALVAVLLSRMSADFLLAGRSGKTKVESSSRETVRSIQAFTDRSIDNPKMVQRLTVGRVADEFRRNSDYLNRIFRVATGTSISEFILMRKLQHACRLLGFGFAVGEAAWASGFTNVKHFATIFKSRIGTTPSGYRKDHHL